MQLNTFTRITFWNGKFNRFFNKFQFARKFYRFSFCVRKNNTLSYVRSNFFLHGFYHCQRSYFYLYSITETLALWKHLIYNIIYNVLCSMHLFFDGVEWKKIYKIPFHHRIVFSSAAVPACSKSIFHLLFSFHTIFASKFAVYYSRAIVLIN
jgi:hypothetical protein